MSTALPKTLDFGLAEGKAFNRLMKNKDITKMGSLRILLALSVVISHSSPIFGITLIPGGLAVEIFFVISGFYMALILTTKYPDRTTFYTNRFLRLYPPYLIIALCTWVWFFFGWMYIERMPTNSWYNSYLEMSWRQKALLIFANWTIFGLDLSCIFHFNEKDGFMPFYYPEAANAPDGSKWVGEFVTVGPAWSIGVEIWFYLLAPLIISLRSFWIALIGVLSLMLKFTMISHGIVTYFFFPAQLCFFMIGMLLYRLYLTAHKFESVDRRVGYAVLAIVILIAFAFPMLPENSRTYMVYSTFIPAIPFLFAVTMDNKIDLSLGNLSYSIYLVHVLVITVLANTFRLSDGVIIVIATILASIAIYLVIEKPIDGFRQKRIGHVRT